MNKRKTLAAGLAAVLQRTVLGGALALTMGHAAVAQQPLRVVASFSILGDMVKNVGGEHVTVATIVGPDGDAHVYEPKPSDAKNLAEAQILFVNGLEFEGWLARLVAASGFKGTHVVATQGITPIVFDEEDDDHDHDHDDDDHDHDHDHDHHHGSQDPHAWQDLSLAQQDYRARAQSYNAQLAALDADIKARAANIPPAQRKVVTSHDAFGYFAQAYDIQFLAAAGISSQSEPSAQALARLIDRIRAENIRAVFVENITSPRLIEQIARETGAKVGGVLYSDALSAQPPAHTYLGMMRWNAEQILSTLGR